MQTSLGCSASSFASILLLVTGLLYAVVQLSDSGSSKASGSIVATPMIGMSNRGPWPKCVGMTGDDCAECIESSTKEVHTVIIRSSNADEGKGFDAQRVRIFVDEDDLVDTVPRLG